MSHHAQHDMCLDLLRVIAIAGTITIHNIHEVFARTDFVGGLSWWVAAALNTLSRTSIPLFIMISGALLFEKLDTFAGAWQRTVTRLGIPLLFWAVWYRVIDWQWFGKPFDIWGMWHMFMNGNVYVFYFLVILMGIYLVQPFVLATSRAASDPLRLVRNIAIISLVIGCVYSLFSFLFYQDSSWWNAATIWLPYYGFFALGHLLYRHHIVISTKVALWLGGLSALILLVGSYVNVRMVGSQNYLLWHNSGAGTQYFDEYLTPFAIGLSCAVFALVIKLAPTILSARVQHWLKQVSLYSFGMYALHSFVSQHIEHTLKFTTQGYTGSLFVFMLIKLSLAGVGSLAIAWLFAKLPFISKLSGTAVKK